MKQKHKIHTVKWAQCDKNPVQRTVRTAHLSVLMTVHSFSTQYKTHTTILRLSGFWPGQSRWAGSRRNSPTHTYCGHQSSLNCFLHLLWSMASSLFSLRAWQSFSTISFQVFFGLRLGLAPSTSYEPLPSFHTSSPYNRNLCCCPSLSLNPLLGTVPCSLMLHIHLSILISAHWSATSFSFLTGQVSLSCNILLHTQMLYNLPLTINDIALLVSYGTNCLNLFHPIRILVSAAATAYPPTLNTHTHNTTVLRLCGICPGKPGWAGTRRNIHPLLSS